MARSLQQASFRKEFEFSTVSSPGLRILPFRRHLPNEVGHGWRETADKIVKHARSQSESVDAALGTHRLAAGHETSDTLLPRYPPLMSTVPDSLS